MHHRRQGQGLPPRRRREGDRTGTRTRSQTGSRTGSLAGSLASTVDYSDKKTGQYTGFFLKDFKSDPTFAPSGEATLNAPVFDAESFDAPELGDVVWGDWQAAPGENPADCLRTDTTTTSAMPWTCTT